MRRTRTLGGVLLFGTMWAATTTGDLTPIRALDSDEAVTAGSCGHWSEGPLAHHVVSPAGDFGGVAPVVGQEACSNTSTITLEGWRRSTKFVSPSRFEVRNKLWFFNHPDPVPGGDVYSGNQDSASEFRMHDGSGRWSRTYTYDPGTGAAASRGVRGKLLWNGKAEVELNLVRTTPSCATGGSVRGDGVAKMVFETAGLTLLSSELRKFFVNRTNEEGMQQWYDPTSSSPETLRRKAALQVTWCTDPTLFSWNFSVTSFPPGFAVGASGSAEAGRFQDCIHTVRIDKAIQLCIRPPAPQADGSSSSFAILLDAHGDTETKIVRTQLAEAIARIELSQFEIRFEQGCVECDPLDGGVEIQSSGVDFTAG